FVPPKPIRTLRNLTRYRKSQIGERQREANRLHKILEDTGIKLDCVATDILGKSGRAMLDALVSGTTDPGVLADLAKGRLRAKIPALQEALRGRFSSEHALVVSAILAHIDFLDEQIERLSDAIEAAIAPYLCRDRIVKRLRSGLTVSAFAEFGGALARLRVRGVVCARAPSLTSVHDPRVGCGAGDMMFDGVIPLGEALRPLGLSGPSTRAWRQGHAGSRPRRISVMKGLARTGRIMRVPAPPRRARAACGSCA
ncbi:MAG: hypothetical protein LC777_21870, partial [Actinobacteria bacterium]|nr:hypothetical protein [Actinomycetota bacterium]